MALMYKKESNKYFFINILGKIVSLPVNLASIMVDAVGTIGNTTGDIIASSANGVATSSKNV